MLKWMGAGLILLSSGIVGFGFAGDIRRQTEQLTALIAGLEALHGEISIRRTPLAPALMILSDSENRQIGQFFQLCAQNLSVTCRTSPYLAIRDALEQGEGLLLSRQTRLSLLSLGMSLGKLDTACQLDALTHAAARAAQELDALQRQSPARAKSYRTIGVCTGLALVVILI